MRLIDADKLAKEIADSINDASIQNDKLSLSILRVFKETVDDAPTIDAEEDYQRGLNDAWRIIQKVFRYVEDGGMPLKELEKAFGTGDLGKIVNLSVEEAMSKLRTYEAKKKAEEEIKVGDEVETNCIGNGIIIQELNDGWYAIICKGLYRSSIHKSHIKKTGRHFPQVEELLDAMKEDGES